MTPTILALLLAAGLPVPPQASQLPPWYHWLFEAFRPAGGGSGTILTVTGISPLALVNALSAPIHSLTQYGKCVQNGTPTPVAPVDILCNNGALKARRQSGLPLGYTLLAYARSSGTQYLDLGYKGNGNTKVEMKYRYYAASSAMGSGRVFGSRTTAREDAFAFGTSSGQIVSAETNQMFWCYDSQPFYVDDGRFGLNVWKTIVFSAKEHSIDGVSVGNDYNIVEFETPQNLKLFGFDQIDGTMGVGYVDVAYCKLWDNGVLVRNIVFAKNASNVVGGYDLVSGQFFTNQGTGDFVAGDPIDDPVEIYTDGTPEVLTVSGANLFNKNAVSFYTLLDTSTGAEIPQSAKYSWASDWIPVTPSTEYYFKSGANYNVRIFEYAADKNYLNLNYTKLNASFTVGASCRYIRFHLGALLGGQAMYNGETMVSLGSEAIPYEPYTAQTASVPTLLGVGDYKDEAELISGIKTGKVGVKVLDGTEGWETVSTHVWRLNIADRVFGKAPLLCSHFNYSAGTSVTMENQTIASSQNSRYIFIRDDDYDTRDDFKAWLTAQYAAGTPVIVVYPLATETTEQTTPNSLHSYNGTTIVSVTSPVDPVELRAEYKGVVT